MNEEEIRQNYITTAEAAGILGITTHRVGRLCIEGRFKGAFKAGFAWLIPRDSVSNHKHLKRGPKGKSTRKTEDIALLKSALEQANKHKEGK